MAELMGALAYLRDLCGNGDGGKFRAKMSALIQADGISQSRRDFLAGAYNSGFESYQMTYRVCTPAAEVVISRTCPKSPGSRRMWPAATAAEHWTKPRSASLAYALSASTFS